MGFDLLRTKGDVTKITALNRSAIALCYHTQQFFLIYTIKWIENGFAWWMLRSCSIKQALLLLLQCILARIQIKIYRQMLFFCFWKFIFVFMSTMQDKIVCKIDRDSIVLKLPTNSSHTYGILDRSDHFLTCKPMG